MGCKVELDLGIDEVSSGVIKSLEERYCVDIEVVDPHGPGGGYPVIVARGTRAELTELIRREWYDEDLLADIVEETSLPGGG